MRKFSLVVVACLLLGVGCATRLQDGPQSGEVLPEALPESTAIPTRWAAPPGDEGRVDDGWLVTFKDATLDALVAESLDTQNPNLRVLAAQVDRAEAAARLAAAALKPVVGLGGALSGTAGSDPLGQGLGAAGVGVAWEVDVWGRVRAGANAAEENLRATVADFEFARQSLAGAVARNWYLATELSMQVGLAQEVVEVLSELVELVETKEKVGEVSMKDVFLVRADLATSQDALQQATAGQQQSRRALEILLGRYPSGEIMTATELVPVPPPVPVGLPSDLIERRPDLIAADRRVAATFFISEEARLAKLPRFGLGAGAGASTGIDGAIGTLVAQGFAPLYTGGALEAQLDIASADQMAAVASYGVALLDALEEVEAALANEALLQAREAFLKDAVNSNEAAYEIAKVQYNVGQIDLLDVLQMQTRWIGGRVALFHVRNLRLTERINLHLALGGGFDLGESNSR